MAAAFDAYRKNIPNVSSHTLRAARIVRFCLQFFTASSKLDRSAFLS